MTENSIQEKQADPSGGGGSHTRRAPETPFGATAFLVFMVAAVPVVLFDDLEVWLEPFVGEGDSMLAIVAVFAFAWLLPGVGLLGAFSPRPDREGLLAGFFVAAFVALQLVRLGMAEPGLWLVLAPISLLFGALAIGLGAAAGFFAGLAQGRTDRTSGRTVPLVAIACGVAIPFVAIPFTTPSDPLRLMAVLLGLALAGGGAWGLWAKARQTS